MMSAPSSSALYVGEVMHQRLRPKRHRLTYRSYYLLFDVDELPALDARLRCFSVGRANLFSLRVEDYGDGTRTDWRTQIDACLTEAGLPTGGAIRLLTLPRLLGHAFNPLSVWFCHAPQGGPVQALIYEVNNTFGERHRYLIATAAPEGAVIEQRCDKALYVSPFNDLAQHYRFRVQPPAETVSVSIGVHDAEGLLLHARLGGQRRALTDAALLAVFFSHPLITLKVVAAIHWEALRLWLKRVPLQARPAAPPARGCTIVALGDHP